MERNYKKIIKKLLVETESNFEDNINIIKDEDNYAKDKNQVVINAGNNTEHYYANKSCLLNLEKFLDGYFQSYDIAYDITGDDSIAKDQQTKYLSKNQLTLIPHINSFIDYNSSVGESFDFISKVLAEESDERLFLHIKENINDMSRQYFKSSIYPEYLFSAFYNSLNCDFYKNKIGIDVNDFFQTNPYAAIMLYSLKKRALPHIERNTATYGISRFSDDLFDFFKDTPLPLEAINQITKEEKQSIVTSFITYTKNLEKLALLFDVCYEIQAIPEDKSMPYLESRIKAFTLVNNQMPSLDKIFESAKEQLYKIENKFSIEQKINAQIKNNEEDNTPTISQSFKL